MGKEWAMAKRVGLVVAEATMTSKGQITVPKEVRDRLGLDAGVKVAFIPDGRGGFALLPRNTTWEDSAGLLARPGQRALSVEEMDGALGKAMAEEWDEKFGRGSTATAS